MIRTPARMISALQQVQFQISAKMTAVSEQRLRVLTKTRCRASESAFMRGAKLLHIARTLGEAG